LLSEKSSHGSIDYPLALLRMAKDHGLGEVFIHVIFDGRSTEPGSAPDMLLKFEKKIQEIGIGKIVTGMGRGIALDRDGNYQKTKMAYDAFVYVSGKKRPLVINLRQKPKHGDINKYIIANFSMLNKDNPVNPDFANLIMPAAKIIMLSWMVWVGYNVNQVEKLVESAHTPIWILWLLDP
jgi:bisphosphoglycerate-independent phosphoglycerate mutase (AlkP superfamily)